MPIVNAGFVLKWLAMGASEVPTANRAGDPPTPSSRAVAAGADNERFANPYIGVGDDRRAQIVAALVEILPPGALLHRQAEVKPYECDGLTVFRQEPVAVALPNTEDEVVRVLKACHRLDVPVVARGAGTGLAGGAMPHGAGVVLSLARLNRIVAIDPLARTARVQPGVRNLAISEVAAPYDLYYAPDPSSQIACTIGGNVSENSGGVHCLKYGLTLNNVLAMRAITIDGAVLTVGSAALDSAGAGPDGGDDRLRGDAGRRHRGHCQADPQAAQRARRHGLVRRRRACRQCGGRDHRVPGSSRPAWR